MATYNGATYLREQLASLAAQTRPPDELVVTDDASTDATLAILAEFAAAAPFPVRIHPNAVRLGYRANFMRAMALCQSDLIALCDQDDVWEAGKIEAALQAFGDPETVLFFHDASLMDATGAASGPAGILSLPPRSAPLSFYPLMNPFGFSIVFRRSLLRFAEHWAISVDNVEAANRMAHDQWIFFLASVFGVIAYSDGRLVRYRQHGANAYGWKRRTGLRDRVIGLLNNNGGDHRQFARAAAGRAQVLRAILAAPLTGREREQAETCAAYYESLSRMLALRSDIYLAPSPYRRALACTRLIRAGGYQRGKLWNIGPKALLKDVALALVFRPLMVRRTDREARAAEHIRRDVTNLSS